QVAVRIRPFIPRELVESEQSCIKCATTTKLIIGKDKEFDFDKIYDQDSSQQKIYEETVQDLVVKFFQGQNVTILAYGQTGSGKTYTMGTSSQQISPEYELGIIPRVINEIFENIKETEKEIRVSYFEIYNEFIIDLLDIQSKKSHNNNIFIREESDGNISLQGLIEEHVNSPQDMLLALEKGALSRSTSSTLMNASSSRSHAIYTVFLHQIFKENIQENQEINSFITSKFHFVDLAGSERIKKTGAIGATLKEGININMGLLALGNVISALTDIQCKHIPYRDSKLTRILQDSLGGNSNTLMIVCVSPAESNFEESLNALKYASRARKIKNKPIVNRDPQSALINKLKEQIQILQQENDQFKLLLDQYNIKVNYNFGTNINFNDKNEEKIKECELKIKNLQAENSTYKQINYNAEIQLLTIQKERDLYRLKWENQDTNIDIKKDIVEEYQELNQKLKKQIEQKDMYYRELQIEFDNTIKASLQDQQILFEKEKTISMYKKAIIDLQKKNSQIISQNDDKNTTEDQNQQNQLPDEDDDEEIIQNKLKEDPEFLMMQEIQQSTKQKINEVDGSINTFQEKVHKLNLEQIKNQQQLLEKMKDQYHQKISQLEDQIKKLGGNKEMINQLNDYKKKAKEQENLQKIIANQEKKIAEYQLEINNYKHAKITLFKQIKKNNEDFEKFKMKKFKDLMAEKRENVQKLKQIFKLQNTNKKQEIQILKKQEDIKKLIRSKNLIQKILQKNKQINQNINKGKSDQIILQKKQKEQQLQNIQLELQQMQQKLIELKQETCSSLVIDEEKTIQLNEIQNRIETLEDMHQFQKQKIQKLYDQDTFVFENIQNDIIKLEDINVLKIYLQSALSSFINITSELLKTQDITQVLEMQQQEYKEQIDILYQQNRILGEQQQQQQQKNLTFTQINDFKSQFNLDNNNYEQNNKKLIQQLEQIHTSQQQQQQQQIQQQQVIQQQQEQSQKIKDSQSNSPINLKKSYYFQENQYEQLNNLLTSLTQNNPNIQAQKNDGNQTINNQIFNQDQAIFNSIYKWECKWKIQDAHQSQVYQIQSHENLLFSTSVKSLKIWDIEAQKSISDINAHQQGNVKGLYIIQDEKMIVTACDKYINIWDLVSLQKVCALKSSNEDIKKLLFFNNILLAGGKGSQNSGALVFWDLRKQQIVEEKEKNQDFFALLTYKNILYCGSRDHYIRRIPFIQENNTTSLEPLQPPHYDIVTSLAVLNDNIVSGSKDHNIKLWGTGNFENNLKQIQYSNQQILCIESNTQNNLVYVGQKDGKIKIITTVNNNKFKEISDISNGLVQVNCISQINNQQNESIFACGSIDKTIKLWKPTQECKENLQFLD
ncbi:kinesin motor domain protein, partial [Ichthyophthirius multifiliis]